MLEIPESSTIARQLKDSVSGKTIATVIAASSPHNFTWYFGDPADYQKLLVGKKVHDAAAVAGQVEIMAEERRIVLHDGVNIRYLEKDAKTPKKHQLYIEFTDGSKLVCTVQMYGGLYVYPHQESNENYYYLISKQKASPLPEQFDEDYFFNIVKKTEQKASVKALLATEQRIPGLGNGSLQDILFNATINPRTKLKDLSDEDWQSLFKSLKTTLGKMASGGGRDTEKDLYGNEGGYKTLLSKKTLTDPCPRCGGNITRQAYMGGNVYFCPQCQPIK